MRTHLGLLSFPDCSSSFESIHLGHLNIHQYDIELVLLQSKQCLSTIFHIEVGPPVARRPPHRSRRAILPHRALQDCSHPHEQEDHKTRCWTKDVILGTDIPT